MTAETGGTPPVEPEIAENAVAHNAGRLFGLFNRLHESQDDPTTTYYRVTWNPEDDTRIAEVTTMQLTPTGARRQESFAPDTRGQFAQAQFIATEHSDTQPEPSERYLWCYTGNRSPLSPALPQSSRMVSDHGYIELSTPNIINTLASGLEGVDNHIQLIDEVNKRGIGVDKKVAKRMRRITYKLLHEALEGQDEVTITAPEYGGKLFEAVHYLHDADPDEAKKLRSQIVSRLLQRLPRRWGNYEPTDDQAHQEAEVLDTFESAFQQGVLPKTSNILNRVMLHHSMYRRPYMTVLLHDAILNGHHKSSNESVLGVHREIFTHTFIVSTLDSRMHALGEQTSETATDIKQVVGRTHSQLFREARRGVSFVFLFNLAERLGYESTENPGITPRELHNNPVQRLYEIGRTFDYILAKIDEVHPEHAEPGLNIQRHEIVEAVLEPRIAIAVDRKKRKDEKDALAALKPKRKSHQATDNEDAYVEPQPDSPHNT